MRSTFILVLSTAVSLAVACKSSAKHQGEIARIVTLTPSATEVVAAAGGLDKLVGVDRYSVYPPQVNTLPKVGDFMHPNFEAIISLKPHLVVLDEVQKSIVAKLDRAGVHTIVLRMHSIAEVQNGLLKVGKAINTQDKAKAAVMKINAELKAISKRVAASKDAKLRVLAIIGREVGTLKTMVAAGPGSYLDELLRRLDATNALASSSVRYPKISVEQVMQSRPDIILDAVREHQANAARADWAKLSRVPAVQNKRIYPLTDQLFMSPGPRVGEAMRRLAALLYPESSPAKQE